MPSIIQCDPSASQNEFPVTEKLVVGHLEFNPRTHKNSAPGEWLEGL